MEVRPASERVRDDFRSLRSMDFIRRLYGAGPTLGSREVAQQEANSDQFLSKFKKIFSL
jgi:hypothetical protein